MWINNQRSLLLNFLILLCFFSFNIAFTSYADDNISAFVKTEISGDNFINGIGTEVWLVNNDTNIGMAVNSSVGNARVTDKLNYHHDYLAWEIGAKFGYFSDVFVYGEFGFDVAELIMSNRDEDNYERYQDELDLVDVLGVIILDDYYQNYDHSNEVDFYLGAGVGVKFDKVTMELFSRYRQIDGQYWKADNQVFSGVKLTISF